MKKISIIKEGPCFDTLIRKFSQKLGDEAAKQFKETAIKVVRNCVAVYQDKFGQGDVGTHGSGTVNQPYTNPQKPIPDGTTGLIYGRVQSGKTNTTIATLALAYENHFGCFIVLTSDNTWLGKQTAQRFNNQLKKGPVVFDWEQWKKDPQDFAKSKVIPYLQDTGVVLVSTKNYHHLERLLQVLKAAKIKQVPTLIFDDEADNASLNTNASKQAKNGKDNIPDSTIFDKIAKIRKEVANHIYLQITATPQSLLLQNLDHPCKPAFGDALLQPGLGYMGGEIFFEENSDYCYKVDADEINQLKKQKGMKIGNNSHIPKGLRLALCCFFLGAIYKMQENDEATYSFLAHVCYKQDNHSHLEKIISDFVVKLDKAIRGQSSETDQQQAKKWLEEAYQELRKTSNLPELLILIDELKYELRSAIPKVINANNPDKQPNYNQGMNILIGGNRLGRGVTIEGLMVTYYGRDAKQKMMDTVHQHARMYGYREYLKDVTRLFLPEHILESFRAIHDADEGMREAIGDNPDCINIQPVWVGKSLKPTRANVLDPTFVDAFTPGKSTFPRDPLWKKSDIQKYTETLDHLLADFQKDDNFAYQVEIDFLIKLLEYMPSKPCLGYNWEDERIKTSLEQMKSQRINKGTLYVRRGKNKEGLNKSNQSRPWQGSGFAQSKWISEPKKQSPHLPILIVMYEKGEKQRGWDNQPLYLPTLIFPKSQFVFMFNYSDSDDDMVEYDDNGEISEKDWLHSASVNPAFDFLNDPEEDIYTLADGKPFHD